MMMVSVSCYVCQAKVSVENVFDESTMEATVKTYTITLSPTVVFRNWLPMNIFCKLMVIVHTEPCCCRLLFVVVCCLLLFVVVVVGGGGWLLYPSV